MGMFSYIKCKKELPLTDELKSLYGKWHEVEFQTKDLGNCLESYVISEQGELFEEITEYKGQKTTEKVDFHGSVTFYKNFSPGETEQGGLSVEFHAHFMYGKLNKIEPGKIEKYKNRRINMAEYWKTYS
jgi:hypothetical protein